MVDFAGGFSAIGGGISDLFASAGSAEAAGGFKTAATDAERAAQLEAASGQIKQAANERSVEKDVGGQRADIGAAGFSFSGSATDLARDTVQQGAISKALIQDQTGINVNADQAKAAEYTSDANQASTASAGQGIGGIIGIGVGLLGLFSDQRLKHNIQRVAVDKEGKNIYQFSYIGSNKRWQGYIAQELDPKDVTDAAGFLGVIETKRAVPLA